MANVNANMEFAFEHNPEAFGRVRFSDSIELFA
jgi:hypothetical protein